MRVLLTASTFPVRPGDGLPAFVLDLARALSSRAEVTVLAPGAPGAQDAEEWDGVSVRRFAYFWPRAWQRLAYADGIDVNLRRSWLARLQAPIFLAREAQAARALGADFDVVNSHWIVPQGLAGALARGRRARFAHVVTLHGGDAHLLGRLPWGGRIARFVAARTDAFLVSSEPVREQLDAALGRPSGASVQPMGVALERFRDAPPLSPEQAGFPGGYLLYVGRLQEIKGVSVLLRAFQRLGMQHPELGLVVIGYGEREAALRAEAAELGLGRRVRFLGRRGADAVASALRGCRVCVVPSLRLADGRVEGMPTVVVEALAAGAPLVATATGGIPDVVRDGSEGWLCAPGDPAALAEAIGRALALPDLEATRERARARAAQFTWERVAERYTDLFDRVMQR